VPGLEMRKTVFQGRTGRSGALTPALRLQGGPRWDLFLERRWQT